MIRGTSEEAETPADKYSARRIQLCRAYFCLGIILEVILKKDVKNDFYKNRPGRFGFFLPRAFQRSSQKCRNPSGSLVNSFFVGSYWTSNPAVTLRRLKPRLRWGLGSS